MLECNNIYLGDCLDIMQKIDDKSIDMILCDLPYETTKCSWDVIIPFDELWKAYTRIIKDSGAILLFGSEPFSSYLRLSNLKLYKYDLYWQKNKPTNFLQLKRRAGKTVENICVFYKKQCTYNPQKYVVDYRVKNKPKQKDNSSITTAIGFHNIMPYKDDGTRYPTDVLKFKKVDNYSFIHPTQKPVDLLEYLIKTYSNEGNVILDNCMGVGSTCIACKNTGRNYIGIEKEETYFNIAKERLEKIG